ncbi:YeaH/YhbH family protein [Pararhizobium mangrovi]|uniref:UPF0229 protein FJU11_01070 n=1 Tax=Pararhizobium mangrovi TaxID=2590452 RepID=A0A506UHP8_9HYPH|nr:YeaH/YhbH family protein [Pararhizobium mangrovi]TPW32844.1 YeaH/YhbH family protein [Pararhizobium mangrovi]
MPNYIDRRLNPKDKSLGNRQRFIRRARDELKRAINEQIRTGRIGDADGKHSVPVPVRGTSEPSFSLDPTSGEHEHVLPGNKQFRPGDKLRKPPGGGGGQGSGGEPGSGGDADDDFRFVLSREEVMDLFFEDLELPHMVKMNLKEAIRYKPRRAGFTTSGSPTNINVARTMKNSFGRRLALNRPKREEIDALVARIAVEEAKPKSEARRRTIAALTEELDRLERRRRRVSYVDPMDIRFNRFEQQPIPNANAVMFCLMDVSGSMGEREKDLAKRFFVLLHMFLSRRYERTDIVFVRHTHEASEVDEETFFYSTRSGGTIVSTALAEMKRIIDERYPFDQWNIYAAQASDGDNSRDDSGRCIAMLDQDIMPLCQYYAYVEIIDRRESDIFRTTENGTALWKAYKQVSEAWETFQMTRIAEPADIYPVFRELFAKDQSVGHG